MDLPWIKAFLNRRTEAARIQADWSKSSHEPSEAEIKRAALLASEGHLTSVEYMVIRNMSITDISPEQIRKLTSIVTERVVIDNMTRTDLLSCILASVKCPDLLLWRMELSEAETQALATAMRDQVEVVGLVHVTLGIEETQEITQFSWDFPRIINNPWDFRSNTEPGSLGVLGLNYVTRTRPYGERLRRWVEDKGWTLTHHDSVSGGLVMSRY